MPTKQIILEVIRDYRINFIHLAGHTNCLGGKATTQNNELDGDHMIYLDLWIPRMSTTTNMVPKYQID